MSVYKKMDLDSTTLKTFASTAFYDELYETLNQSTNKATDYSDKYENDIVNSVYLVTTAICLMFSGLSLIAINRTHGIPRTACFLSSTLLIFDCATTFTYATRKLVTDSDTLNVITMIGLGWSYASFINVAVMAMERLLVFQWPYFYMRHVSHSTSIKALATILVLYLGTWTTEWTVCYITTTGFWKIRECFGTIIKKYMTATFVTLAVVTSICFIKTLFIITKQRRKVLPQSETATQNHRPTIVVFVCCLNYLFTAAVNIVLVYTISHLTIFVRRTILDVLYMFNGLVDTFVYVLWYKECRYELVKLLAVCLPPLRAKAERMRVQLFGIIGQHETTDSRNTD